MVQAEFQDEKYGQWNPSSTTSSQAATASNNNGHWVPDDYTEYQVNYDKQLIKDTMLIPNGINEWNAELYELTGYINNINTQHTQVLMEYGTKGFLRNIYDYGVQRNSVTNLSKTHYYDYDGRGSVSEIVTANAKTVMSYSYTAFGESTVRYYGYVQNPYRYNAENVDRVPGIPDFQYLRARYYTPYEGRFINQDTLFGEMNVPLTQNLYLYVINNAVNMKDPSGHSLEIIMGLERARSQALHNISVQQARLSNMAISHERAQIQAKINSYQDNISEYDRQIRFQKGQTTLYDVNIQKEHDRKIEELIIQVKLLKIYQTCGEAGFKLFDHEFLDWLTPEERFSAVYLSQEKNKSTGELISGYNPLTVDDFVKLGIDKDSIHEDYLSIYNFAFKLSMHGTSIEEQEAQYSAKKRAELDATMRILVLQFASNSTRNLNQHSKYGVAKPKSERTGSGSSYGDNDAKIPRSGAEWNDYFKSKYGADNVSWETASINDIVNMPSKITNFSPQQVANMAKSSGWSVEPLGKGSLAGMSYEEGGGFSMRAPNGGSEYIQYHPGGGHHGSSPYYKISSGPNGTVRYDINGGMIS